MPQLSFVMCGLSDNGAEETVELRFDPASEFTWIDAETFLALDVNPYRRRRMVMPCTNEIAWVDTVVVDISWQASMRGVDEVAVAPNPTFRRLGRRTLHALQARIVQVDGEPLLVPQRPAFSFDELQRRARIVCQLDFPDEPIQQDEYALASMVFTILMHRLATRVEFSHEFLVAELKVVLKNVVGCRAADLWSYSCKKGEWKRRWKSANFRHTHPIQQLLEIAANPEVADERLLAWRFPSQQYKKQIEPAALCAVAPETPDEAAFLQRFMSLISPSIDLLFFQSGWTAALRDSRDSARQLLRFDRNREAATSYNLLDDAKRVLPTWSNISFWRTSRTTGSLERRAEHNVEERKVRLDTIREWKRDSDSTSQENGDLATIAAIAIPTESDIEDDSPEHAQLVRMLAKPRRLAVETTQKACYQVYVSHGDIDDATAVDENLGALLDNLNLRGAEVVVVLWARTLEQGSEFHLVVTVVDDAGNLGRINEPALVSLKLALLLRLQQFNVLSAHRHQLRLIGDFLTRIHTAPDKTSLRRQLSKFVSHLLPDTTFAVFDRQSYTAALASDDQLQSQLDNATSTLIPEIALGEVQNSEDLQELGAWGEVLAAHAQGLKVHAHGPTSRIDAAGSIADEGELRQWTTRGILAPINDRLILAVARAKSSGEPWKPSSMEISYVRMVAAALQLTRPLQTPLQEVGSTPHQEIGSARQDDSSEVLHRLLTTRVFDASVLNDMRSMLNELKTRVDASAGITATSTLFAVDVEQKFIKVVVGEKTGVVHANDDSMLTKVLSDYGKQKDTMPTQLGIVAESGRAIELVNEDLSKTSVSVPFLGLIEGASGDLIAARGFSRLDKQPMGFIVLRLGPAKRFSDSLDLLTSVRQQIESYSEKVAMALQRQIQIREDDVRQAVKEPFTTLRGADISPISSLSELESPSENATKHLPSPLRRVFTARYCESLTEILQAVRDRTRISSITCRVRYPSLTGEHRIWLLAKVGDSRTFREEYPFNSRQNVHSWVCEKSETLHSKPSIYRVFLPDVGQTELCETLYPGIRYHPGSEATEVEMCFGFGIPGDPKLCVSLNIEAQDFFQVWMLEEHLGQLAERLASEVVLHYSRSEAGHREGINLGVLFVRSLDHEVDRLEFASPSEFSEVDQRQHEANLQRVTLETRIANSLIQDADGKTEHQKVSLRETITEGVQFFRNLSTDSQVEIIESTVDIEVATSLKWLLAKLLFEQSDTLNRIEDSRPAKLLVGWRRRPDGGVVVDFFNNRPPKHRATVALADKLFWYEIDRVREAPGRSGIGLYLIGQMLRMVGCRPVVQRRPTRILLEGYEQEIQTRILKSFHGMSVELNFSAVAPKIPTTAGREQAPTQSQVS